MINDVKRISVARIAGIANRGRASVRIAVAVLDGSKIKPMTKHVYSKQTGELIRKEEATPVHMKDFATHAAIALTVAAVMIVTAILKPPAIIFGRLMNSVATLTPRELQVLRLAAVNVPNKGIAVELGIHVDTAKKHRLVACQKLKLNSPVALAHYFIQHGLVENIYKATKATP